MTSLQEGIKEIPGEEANGGGKTPTVLSERKNDSVNKLGSVVGSDELILQNPKICFERMLVK